MDTTRANELTDRDVASEHIVPEFWPEGARQPRVRRVWIPWPVAVLLAPLFWLMPKRLGAHLAAGSWWGAIIGHAVWAYYGFGWFMMTAGRTGNCSWTQWLGWTHGRTSHEFWPAPTFGEILLAPLAAIPILIGTSRHVQGFIAGAVGAIVVEIFVLGIALLLMPYATAGEPLRPLLGRCLKLTWWCTTGLTACGIVFNGLLTVLTSDLRFGLVAGACVLWFALLLVRSAARYAGKPAGAEWQPISAQCDRCGYGLTALLYESNCPECGLPVRESLPSGRRPSRFAAGKGLLGRLAGFVRTFVAVLVDRRFFTELRIRGEHGAAARFGVWMCIVTAAALSWPIVLPPAFERYYQYHAETLIKSEDCLAAVVALMIVTVCLIGALGAMCLLWSGFGYRPLQRYSTVVFYWSAWLLPVGVTAAIGAYLVWWLIERQFFRHMLYVPQLGSFNLYYIVAVLPAVIPITLGVHSLFRLGRALRQTQYANA